MAARIAYTVVTASTQSGVGRTKIFEASKHGQLRAKRNGRKLVILHEDLEEYVKSLPDRASEIRRVAG